MKTVASDIMFKERGCRGLEAILNWSDVNTTSELHAERCIFIKHCRMLCDKELIKRQRML